MDPAKEQLQAEIRYAMRLCQRTARMYRRVQSLFTFFTVLAGSSALVSVSANMPTSATLTAAFVFAIAGAANLAARPADKIAINDADVRKYAALLLKSETLDVAQIRILIAEARQSDAPEIEPLRHVAFNDVMIETGREHHVAPLTMTQRLFNVIA
jgi:hypothetical protein